MWGGNCGICGYRRQMQSESVRRMNGVEEIGDPQEMDINGSGAVYVDSVLRSPIGGTAVRETT